MANEHEDVIEKEEEVVEEEAEESKEQKEDKEEKVPDRKPESPEARKARLDRMSDQHRKKYPELYEEKPVKRTEKKSDELDYGQLAFLTAKGIEDEDEVDFVKERLEESGKPLKELLGKKWFQDELKELREAKATTEATPKDTKRPGQSAQDTVEYWIAKGELPKDRELREKVVNARIAKEKKTNVFGN